MKSNNETINSPRGDTRHERYTGLKHNPYNEKESYDTLMDIVTGRKTQSTQTVKHTNTIPITKTIEY